MPDNSTGILFIYIYIYESKFLTTYIKEKNGKTIRFLFHRDFVPSSCVQKHYFLYLLFRRISLYTARCVINARVILIHSRFSLSLRNKLPKSIILNRYYNKLYTPPYGVYYKIVIAIIKYFYACVKCRFYCGPRDF